MPLEGFKQENNVIVYFKGKESLQGIPWQSSGQNHVSIAEGMGVIPVWKTNILHAVPKKKED